LGPDAHSIHVIRVKKFLLPCVPRADS